MPTVAFPPDVLKTTRAFVGSPVTIPAEEIEKIPLAWNPRLPPSEESIIKLAHAIASDPLGQLEPVHILKGRDGQPAILKGQRRRLAILYLNANISAFQTLYPDSHITGPYGLRAIVFTGMTPQQAILHALSDLDQEPLSPLDKAHAIRSLRNQGWEDADIAKALRVNANRLSEMVDYLGQPEEVQSAIHEGAMTEQLARAAKTLPEDELVEVAQRARVEHRERLAREEEKEAKKEAKAKRKNDKNDSEMNSEDAHGGSSEESVATTTTTTTKRKPAKPTGKKKRGSSAEIMREVNKRRRARGERVPLTMKEFLDMLWPLADGNGGLAYDLWCFINNERVVDKDGTELVVYTSLEHLLSTYDSFDEAEG